ncbi:nucleic acid/nucleotide deaminase domain-containing protein [Nocardia sp. NPDC055321]
MLIRALRGKSMPAKHFRPAPARSTIKIRLPGRRIAVAASVLVMICVLVVVGREPIPGHAVARQQTSPFYGAIVDLLTQSAVHLTGSRTQGGTWDVRATASGEMLGQVTEYGRRTDLLAVDGRVYAKPPSATLGANLPPGLQLSAVEGRWLTGSDELAEGIPDGVWAPRDLAVELTRALDRTRDFPRIGDPALQVGAVRALEVTTPAGRLTVAANAPYRMLMFTPNPDADASSSAAPSTTERGGEKPTAPVSLLRHSITFVPMSSDERSRMFDDLVAATQTLDAAVDIGVRLDYKPSGTVRCGNQICTVDAIVTNLATKASGARTPGSIAVVLRAAVTVDGVPSAGCTAVQSIPINRQVTLTCNDTSVGPLITAAERKQALTGSPARIDYAAEVDVRAQPLPRAEIDRFVAGLRAARAISSSAATCGPACTYTQIAYGSDSLSRAANRARLDVRGRPWRNTVVALVPGWNDPTNGDMVIGIADGQSENATGKSENQILDQLAAKGFKVDQITSLFSERQPCFVTCGSRLATELRPKTTVAYSIPWLPNNAQGYIAGNDLLDRLTVESGGRASVE